VTITSSIQHSVTPIIIALG